MRLSRLNRAVRPALVIVAALVALLTWAVSSPPGSSPDDDYHMASIWCGTVDSTDLCEQTGVPSERALATDVLEAASCFAFDPDKAATCALNPDATKLSTRGNWNGEAYPPVYYAVMHAFAGHDLSVSVVAIRAANAMLYVGILAVLFFVIPATGRRALVWGALVTSVPLGVFIVASVNPSSWAVLSASGLWVAVWAFFVQSGWRKAAAAVLTVLLVVIGAGARGDSAAYAVLALIAGTVLAFRRDRRYARDLLLPVGLVVVSAALFFTAGQSAVVGGATVVKNDTYTFSELLFINIKALPQLLAGFLGTWGLGWLDTYMPGIVWVTALTVFSALVFWGLRLGDARKWLALAGVGAGVIAVPLYILMHDGVVVGNGVQPRYVFPLIVMFAGIAVFGFARSSLGLGKVQLSVAAIGLVVANSVALHVNLRRYVTGLDRVGVNLDRDIEWWWNAPVSPMGLWLIGTLSFAAMVGLLLTLAWPSRAAEAADGEFARPRGVQDDAQTIVPADRGDDGSVASSSTRAERRQQLGGRA
ncbi:hypothetical protein QE410_002390 [Microbacterium sp. SORGH_AS 1204]|uniref:DUF2142 domain-containing protein n=1 Tax=Microbacterium sp. SORGH_AS_1204 TaxID=3041785 RepID=UPI00278CFDD2|nr:DUF2142 domain-containing protein [Microbacterium sp. SORGH_AS_1204]MDQ1137591.1 hypothetical protein [Microbacterium sp. SORGH_AS_1204]